MNVYTATGCTWEETRLAKFIRRHGYGSLEQLQRDSATHPELFWDRVLEEIGLEWRTPYDKTLDLTRGVMWPQWFVGGRLDLCDNLVGRHARNTPSKAAIRWEGDAGEQRTITYAELDLEVAKLAGALRKLGICAGDRIAIYLPMIPEAAVAMLAATRIGAIFIPFFSGYGAESVASRIGDCEAKVLVCANGYFRRGKVVPMLTDAREAAARCATIRHLLVVDRLGAGAHELAGPTGMHFDESDYAELIAAAEPDMSCEAFPADQPLMLIYTSGTTGKPKGVVHTHGGFPVKAAQDLVMAFDLRQDDTLTWMTDMGWLMGPWMVFGGLLLGATIVLYEGTADFPNPDRLWRLVESHGITHLGISPSLVRLLMATDPAWLRPDSLATLRVFGSTGEPWNDSPWVWLFETVGHSRCPIINYSGGTEIGGGIISGFAGLPQKPCAFAGPIPGMAAEVLDENANPVRNSVGELVILQPWPGMTSGFWQDDARYEEAYWSKWPGIWVHGDWARIDEDGYWFVNGRSDDTIKVAGKRVGPADFESALVSHGLVTEAVAIGVPDEMKGESVVCFITALDEKLLASRRWAEWESQLRDHVGKLLGKPLRPSSIYHIGQIPKTRNGKILRRVVRSAYLGASMGDLSSMENPDAIAEIGCCRPLSSAGPD